MHLGRTPGRCNAMMVYSNEVVSHEKMLHILDPILPQLLACLQGFICVGLNSKTTGDHHKQFNKVCKQVALCRRQSQSLGG
jgi:hypothetical protein